MGNALAIVLLLNGVQVELPRPALLAEGVACVPLRAVCERLGGEVWMGEDGAEVIVRARGDRHAFRLRKALSASRDDMAVNVAGIAYVPARSLVRAFGGRCTWDSETRTVELRLPSLGKEPLAASRESVTRDALAWRGCLVVVEGRHGGRLGSPLSPSLRGPAPAEGFSVLAEPAGIYCSSQEFEHVAPCRPPLSELGRPLRITGYVSVDELGRIFLKPLMISTETSAPKPSLHVRSDRLKLQPGEQAFLSVSVRNDSSGRMELDGSGGLFELELESPRGERWVLTERGPATAAGVRRGLAPGVGISQTFPWRPPAGSGRENTGVWRARLRAAGSAEAAECRFWVLPPRTLAFSESEE